MAELNHKVVAGKPIPAASVILLRDAADGLEVFMVQRHSRSGSFGGAHVFPGGKLDVEDEGAGILACLDRRPDFLHQQLGESDISAAQAAALYVAACRETFEECGVLLAPEVGGAVQHKALNAQREGLGFVEVVESLDLEIDVGHMAPWSRWITPVMPSLSTKRFDTRFFVVLLPDGQRAVHDNHEAMDSVWLSPREGLDRFWARELDLAPPQIMTLAHLSRFRSAEEAIGEALRRPPPLIQPEPIEAEGVRVVAYPGDPAHPVATRAMPGPSRLRFANGRFEPEEGYEAFFR